MLISINERAEPPSTQTEGEYSHTLVNAGVTVAQLLPALLFFYIIASTQVMANEDPNNK